MKTCEYTSEYISFVPQNISNTFLSQIASNTSIYIYNWNSVKSYNGWLNLPHEFEWILQDVWISSFKRYVGQEQEPVLKTVIVTVNLHLVTVYCTNVLLYSKINCYFYSDICCILKTGKNTVD